MFSSYRQFRVGKCYIFCIVYRASCSLVAKKPAQRTGKADQLFQIPEKTISAGPVM